MAVAERDGMGTHSTLAALFDELLMTYGKRLSDQRRMIVSLRTGGRTFESIGEMIGVTKIAAEHTYAEAIRTILARLLGERGLDEALIEVITLRWSGESHEGTGELLGKPHDTIYKWLKKAVRIIPELDALRGQTSAGASIRFMPAAVDPKGDALAAQARAILKAGVRLEPEPVKRSRRVARSGVAQAGAATRNTRRTSRTRN